MPVDLSSSPPPDWSHKVCWPVQFPAFAEAGRSLGYVPYYATGGGDAIALVQTRGAHRLLRCLTGRAYVYVSNETSPFIEDLLVELKRRGFPFVRIGNTMWGITHPEALLAYPDCLEEKFTFVVNTSLPEELLWNALDGTIRRAIRGAQKHGVTVRESTRFEDLHCFYPVFAETGDRILQRNQFVPPPIEFFRTVLERMVPAGQAVYYMAEYQERCIGVLLNLIHDGTMLYHAGGSLREYSKQNAPSLMHWHAIQQCQARGLHRYDLGGCSPNVTPNDSRYGVFHFKQKWGGTLEKFYNAEIYLSPGAKAIQEFLRNRIWPIYQRLKRV